MFCSFWILNQLKLTNLYTYIDSAYHLELLHQFEFGHSVPFQALGTLILWFGWYVTNIPPLSFSFLLIFQDVYTINMFTKGMDLTLDRHWLRTVLWNWPPKLP